MKFCSDTKNNKAFALDPACPECSITNWFTLATYKINETCDFHCCKLNYLSRGWKQEFLNMVIKCRKQENNRCNLCHLLGVLRALEPETNQRVTPILALQLHRSWCIWSLVWTTNQCGPVIRNLREPLTRYRVILRIDIYNLFKKSNTWSGYVHGYRKIKYPVFIYNFGAQFFWKNQISM